MGIHHFLFPFSAPRHAKDKHLCEQIHVGLKGYVMMGMSQWHASIMFKFLKDCWVSIFLVKSLVNQSLTSYSQPRSSSLVLPLRHKWTQAVCEENMGMLVFWPGHIHDGKLLASACICHFQERISSRNKRQKYQCSYSRKLLFSVMVNY